MPAYELREHRTDHGYDVIGKYATVDEAWAKKTALINEDPQRQGRYTIQHVQEAQPDMTPPTPAEDAATQVPREPEEDEMALRRTKAPDAPDLPKNSAADMVKPDDGDAPVRGGSTAADAVEGVRGKEPTVSEAAKTAGAKKP